jgi:hypothetical protein
MSVYPAPFLDTVGVYPDLLGDLRTWLRAHPYLTALKTGSGASLLNGRVFFRIPDDAIFPLIRIYDAGITKQPGEVPIIDGQIGVDIWGGTYADVTAIRNAVAAAFDLLDSGTLIGSTTVVLNAESGTSVDSPDPDTGAPRKVLTPTVTARALTANG